MVGGWYGDWFGGLGVTPSCCCVRGAVAWVVVRGTSPDQFTGPGLGSFGVQYERVVWGDILCVFVVAGTCFGVLGGCCSVIIGARIDSSAYGRHCSNFDRQVEAEFRLVPLSRPERGARFEPAFSTRTQRAVVATPERLGPWNKHSEASLMVLKS